MSYVGTSRHNIEAAGTRREFRKVQNKPKAVDIDISINGMER
jgi:hypothetical protein